MRIVASNFALDASQTTVSLSRRRVEVQAWIGERPSRQDSTPPAPTGSDAVGLRQRNSAQAFQGAASTIARVNTEALSRVNPRRTVAPRENSEAEVPAGSTQSAASDMSDEELLSAPNGSQLVVLRRLLEVMTGRKIQVLGADDLSQREKDGTVGLEDAPNGAGNQMGQASSEREGWGLELDVELTRVETSSQSFTAAGKVVTADGKTFAFDISYAQTSEQVEVSRLSLRAGDAREMKDPLVLLYSGTAVELGERVAKFDLDNDGTEEQVKEVTNGAYLIVDRNENSVVDDASEVLGALSNDGFADLRALDEDRNGFVDAGDSSYVKVYLWDPTATPNAQLTSLAEAQVGALFTGEVAMPSDITSKQGEVEGRVRAAGIYLTDGGAAGLLQQIDLVQPVVLEPLDLTA